MKKSILITSAVAGTIGLLAAVSTFAAASTGTTSLSGSMKTFAQGMNRDHGMMEGRGGPMMENLTTIEQTALTSMSDTEKKAFFDKKRAEMDAKRDAHEIVIDKLLAGTALTADEETIRQEIIKNRADMKTKRAEMEAKRTQIEAVIAKKNAGTTLTSEEQALLGSMPTMGRKGGRGNEGGQKGHRGENTPTTTTAQ